MWEALVEYYSNHDTTNNVNGRWPKNISVLLDESKGTGVCVTDEKISSMTLDHKNNKKNMSNHETFSYPIGYAGGLGPHNIREVLPKIIHATCQQSNQNQNDMETTITPPTFWIDMESHIRSSIKNQKEDDIFDLDKCYAVIQTICELGYIPPPSYLA